MAISLVRLLAKSLTLQVKLGSQILYTVHILQFSYESLSVGLLEPFHSSSNEDVLDIGGEGHRDGCIITICLLYYSPLVFTGLCENHYFFCQKFNDVVSKAVAALKFTKQFTSSTSVLTCV